MKSKFTTESLLAAVGASLRKGQPKGDHASSLMEFCICGHGRLRILAAMEAKRAAYRVAIVEDSSRRVFHACNKNHEICKTRFYN